VWAWIRGFLAFWWDRLIASDVGLVRFTAALRVTVAVVLSFLVIDTLSHLTPLPMTMIVMGIIESLFGSVAVRDPSPGSSVSRCF
jgi:tetrahydromethanopterin S-methyltransferase subunit E